MLTPLANASSIHRRPSVKWPCIHQNSHSDHPILATDCDSPFPSSHAIAARTLFCSVSSLLNAWCELSDEDLSGRCPRFRVGLPPVPEGKGTDSSCSTWTPSSLYSTLRSTTSARPARQG